MTQKMPQPTVIDLFAGAGGLSEGFIRSKYNLVSHIETDKSACNTLVTRMVFHALIAIGQIHEYRNYVLGKTTLQDLITKYGLEQESESVICASIGKDSFKELIQRIQVKLAGKGLDVIIGGPPCQAYSCIGRSRDRNGMRDDDRNFLYKYYVEFLKALKPKIFLFENVPGLVSAANGRYLRSMRRLMDEAGYESDYRILNAADFGVPQNRKRIILVGWSRDSKMSAYPNFPVVDRSYVVNDFLAGLPRIQAGIGVPTKKFKIKSQLLQSLGIVDPEFGLLMDHVSRPNTIQDLEIYSRAVLAKQRGENLKYNRLPGRLKSHSNEESFLDRFKVVDSRVKGSHTIVAHIAKDGHFYIHPDLEQNRSITVREAARLQTFPDNYKFEGNRSAKFIQIGNAVPPMLSTILATELRKYL